jgi:hypothetical protein
LTLEPAVEDLTHEHNKSADDCSVVGCFLFGPECVCTNCKGKCHFFCAHLTKTEVFCFNCRSANNLPQPFEIDVNYPSQSLASHFPAEMRLQTISGTHPKDRGSSVDDQEGGFSESMGEVCGAAVSAGLQLSTFRV